MPLISTFGAMSVRGLRGRTILPVELDLTDNYQSTTSQTTYTITSAAIGAARADRIVLVCLSAYRSGAATVSSATVGGVAATIIREATHTNQNSTILAALVPADTTADISITMSSACTQWGVVVYRMINTGGSLTPYDENYNSVAATSSSTTIDTPENGAVLATFGSAGGASAVNVVWSGGLVTEQTDNTAGSTNYRQATAIATNTSQASAASVATSISGGQSGGTNLVVASFAPG